jgi:cathepsin B
MKLLLILLLATLSLSELETTHIDHRLKIAQDSIMLPPNFDARGKWGNCIHTIKNVDNCLAGGYAFTTASVLSDRFCINSGGLINTELSAQYILNCEPMGFGCQGGVPKDAFDFAEKQGLVTEDCLPFVSQNGAVPDCQKKCMNPQDSFTSFKCKEGSVKSFNDTESIMFELMHDGPMFCNFDVYTDFWKYKSGVYFRSSPNFRGDVCAKLVGWGLEDGVKFWILAYHQGDQFGMFLKLIFCFFFLCVFFCVLFVF